MGDALKDTEELIDGFKQMMDTFSITIDERTSKEVLEEDADVAKELTESFLSILNACHAVRCERSHEDCSQQVQKVIELFGKHAISVFEGPACKSRDGNIHCHCTRRWIATRTTRACRLGGAGAASKTRDCHLGRFKACWNSTFRAPSLARHCL